jgi:hypothetical protein
MVTKIQRNWINHTLLLGTVTGKIIYPFWKRMWQFFIKLNKYLQYSPAITFVCNWSKKKCFQDF